MKQHMHGVLQDLATEQEAIVDLLFQLPAGQRHSATPTHTQYKLNPIMIGLKDV
jgi:hypothetical protein